MSQDSQVQMDFIKNKVLSIDDKDRRVWELISDVPKLSKVVAVVLAILNIVVPGKTPILFENYV